MLKIVTAIVVIIVTFIIFFWIKSPNVTGPDLPQNILGKFTIRKYEKPLLDQNSDDFLSGTKDSLEQKSKNTLNNIKEEIYDKAQQTLNTVFNKKPENDTTVKVSILHPSQAYDLKKNSLFIDFSKDQNLNLNLSKNTKYYLQFKNVPSNFCLYIDTDKYKIGDGNFLQLEFKTAGSYPMKANLCDLNDKIIGNLIVE